MTIDDVIPAPTSEATATSEPNGTGCVFCGIVAGQVEASLVYADDIMIAFMDVHPVNPGHVLVVPREHSPGLAGLDEEHGTQMWRLAHRIANALPRSGLRVEGVNIFLADGKAAFQEVFHIHLHIMPRYAGDDLKIVAPYVRSERAALDTSAALIGRALARLS